MIILTCTAVCMQPYTNAQNYPTNTIRLTLHPPPATATLSDPTQQTPAYHPNNNNPISLFTAAPRHTHT